jgi:hypothetical protein
MHKEARYTGIKCPDFLFVYIDSKRQVQYLIVSLRTGAFLRSLVAGWKRHLNEANRNAYRECERIRNNKFVSNVHINLSSIL